MLLNVCEFPQQRRSLPSILTGFSVPVVLRVPAALSPQSRVKVFASLTIVGSLAVGAFDLVNYSLSVVGLVPVLNVGQ